MATTTTNYGLKKPDYNDKADIGVINDNMDIIDTELKNISETLTSDLSHLKGYPYLASGSIENYIKNNFILDVSASYDINFMADASVTDVPSSGDWHIHAIKNNGASHWYIEASKNAENKKYIGYMPSNSTITWQEMVANEKITRTLGDGLVIEMIPSLKKAVLYLVNYNIVDGSNLSLGFGGTIKNNVYFSGFVENYGVVILVLVAGTDVLKCYTPDFNQYISGKNINATMVFDYI